MESLPDDIHYTMLKYLDFSSIKNLYLIFYNSTIFKEEYEKYIKSVKVCEKYLIKRIKRENNKTLIKSNFDSLNQNKYFFLYKKLHIKVKDLSGHIYNTSIISLNTNNEICDKSCFYCGTFYPSLLCMIVCKHHCTCFRCKFYLEQFLLDDTFYFEAKTLFTE